MLRFKNLSLLFSQKDDPVVEKIYDSTEEGKKVARNKGDKFFAAFRRVEDPFSSKTGTEDMT